MVADDGVFLEEIVEDDAEAELLERGKVDGDGFGALGTVTPGHIGRHGLTIGDYPIDQAVREVLLDGAERIGKGGAGGVAGLGHEAGDVDASCEEKIAEIVADEAASRVKTILEQSVEKGFIFRKSHHAVANVAGREDAILAAQAAGAAAVIGDGDDGGEIGDGTLGAGVLVGAADDVVLEAAKQRGQSGAAAESDNPEASG